MNGKPNRPIRLAVLEIASSTAFFLLAGIVLYGTTQVRPPRYEPLGAGFVPQWLAILLGILAITTIGRAVLRWRTGTHDPAADDAAAAPGDWKPAAAMGIATAAFVLALAFEVASFVILSSVFLIVSATVLAGRDWRLVGIFAPAAILASIVIGWVFSELIFVPLP